MIKGENVIGVYDAEDTAYFETEKSYEAGTFLIQFCEAGDSSLYSNISLKSFLCLMSNFKVCTLKSDSGHRWAVRLSENSPPMTLKTVGIVLRSSNISCMVEGLIYFLTC